MDHHEIEEWAVVDRYLLGQLPEEEAQRFERHYLSCPECLDRLELAERFGAGLRRAAAQDAERAVATAGLATLWRLSRSWRLGLAAAFALVLLLPSAFLVLELREVRGELASALRPAPGTLLLPLDAVRGEAAEPGREIRLPAEPGWIVLELEPDAEGPYRAALEAAGTARWEASRLARDPSGLLRLSFHSTFLEPGDYELLLEPDQGPIARFSFRVLPPS